MTQANFGGNKTYKYKKVKVNNLNGNYLQDKLLIRKYQSLNIN